MDSFSEESLPVPSSRQEDDSGPDSESDSTSEVGSEHMLSMRDHKSIVRELIRTVTKKKKGHMVTRITLPRFNPEAANADPAAWCSAVSLLMKDNPLKNSALYSALNRALEGPAAYWLTQIMDGEEITWPAFKEQFIALFDGQETAASSLIKVSKELQRENESSGAYGNRLISLLYSKWRNSTMEEVASAAVL